MTRDFDECFHTLVSFSNGLLYDGGVGFHSRDTYGGYILLDMLNFNKYFWICFPMVWAGHILDFALISVLSAPKMPYAVI